MEFHQHRETEPNFITKAKENLPIKGDLIVQATITRNTNGEIKINYKDSLIQGFTMKILEEVKTQISLYCIINPKLNQDHWFLIGSENINSDSKSIVLSKILPVEMLSYLSNAMFLKTLKVSNELLLIQKSGEIFIQHGGTSDLRENGIREKLVFPEGSIADIYLKNIIRSIADNEKQTKRRGLFQKILVAESIANGRVVLEYESKLIYLFP